MSRQQEWAKGALAKVLKAAKSDEAYVKKYNTACKKGASMVQRVGALQAMAFWMSRSDQEFVDFAEDLAEVWQKTKAESMRKTLMDANTESYMALTRDLTEVALWFRRMAQAELRVADDDGNEDR